MNIITTTYINMHIRNIRGVACIYIRNTNYSQAVQRSSLAPTVIASPVLLKLLRFNPSLHVLLGFSFFFKNFILTRGIIVIVASHIPPNLISVTTTPPLVSRFFTHLNTISSFYNSILSYFYRS